MLKALLIIYIICSFLLIFLILMSKGKGAEIGATLNSSTNDIFGSKGSNSTLNKIIILIALISLIINISINLMNTQIKEKKQKPLVNIYKNQTYFINLNKNN